MWGTADPIFIAYHDLEWGTPIHDDRLLFEFLVLEGAQAGLSWITILKKRDNYIKAFQFAESAYQKRCENISYYIYELKEKTINYKKKEITDFITSNQYKK